MQTELDQNTIGTQSEAKKYCARATDEWRATMRSRGDKIKRVMSERVSRMLSDVAIFSKH